MIGHTCSTDPFYEVYVADYETETDAFECIMRMMEFAETIANK